MNSPDLLDFEQFKPIAAAILTIAVCLVIHAFVLFGVLRWQVRFRRRFPAARGVWLVVPSILLATVMLVASSFLQIVIWAAVLWRFGNFDTVNDALYFSGTTYTTLGTGKHVLVSPNRVLEPVEATNGMLAAGLNTALLFSILSSMAKKHTDYDDFFR
jgi:glucan phosphoethanolaminetransferase (alkaline phosphatase superfamily)